MAKTGRRPRPLALTVAEAARALGVCSQTVIKQIALQELRAFKAGVTRGWRIDRSEIEDFKRRRTVRPATPIERSDYAPSILQGKIYADSIDGGNRVAKFFRKGNSLRGLPSTIPKRQRKGAA